MKNYILSAFSDEYANDFVEQLKALNDFDIQYTELRFVDGINVSELTDEQVREVQTKLSYYGIGVSAIGSPIGKISLDDDFDAHLEKAKKVFTTANLLGAKNIRFFSFYPYKDKEFSACDANVYERLEKLVDLSEEYGVVLCHENEAKIYGESPNACVELMKHFKGRIKCVFDMGNFVLDGYNPYPDGLNLLREHIEYFHIKDSLFAGAIVPPGKGEANIPQILKEYRKDMSKDTFITLEPHLQTFSGLNALVGKQFTNPYQYPDQKTAFKDAVKSIKGILENI